MPVPDTETATARRERAGRRLTRLLALSDRGTSSTQSESLRGAITGGNIKIYGNFHSRVAGGVKTSVIFHSS